MAQLRQDKDRLDEACVQVMVVGPEKPTAFVEFWERERMPFVGLPDPKHTVLKLYGQQVNLFKLGRMPAQMLIDPEGVLRFVHYGHSMSDIPTTDEILAAVTE